MKICGIIAEYNPFHYGHEYHIKKARELTGCDYVVVCMSGDYVQRGLPAITDKHIRTKTAIYGGADLVVELPVIYATGSAEFFAYGAVSILNQIGCEYLCFGSETGDVCLLNEIANAYDVIEHEEHEKLADLQKQGMSYIKAIELLLPDYLSNDDFCELKSNDKLGISYLRAINKIGSKMSPVPIKRVGSDYLDNKDGSDSAMAIRNKIKNCLTFDEIKKDIPDYSFDIYKSENVHNYSFPIYQDDFSDVLFMKLMSICNDSLNESEAREKLSEYLDVSNNIAGRIVKMLPQYESFESFVIAIHSPEYTMSRIYRALIHILLNIKEKEAWFWLHHKIEYARILGFNENAGLLLSYIKEFSNVKLISKLADAENILSDIEMGLLKKDISASNLYDYICAGKFNRNRQNEYSRKMNVLKIEH